MAQIVQYQALAANPAAPLGVLEAGGFNLTNVTTSGTAANTNLDASTRYVEIRALTKAINVDIGDGVTADANSFYIPAFGEKGFALPIARNETWRVSIIDD